MRNPKTNIHRYSVGTSGSSSFLHISLFLLVIVVTEMSLRAQSASEVLWAGVTEVFDRWTSKTSPTPSDSPTPGRATCSNGFPRFRIDVGLCQRCPSATDACSVVYMWYIISEILIDKWRIYNYFLKFVFIVKIRLFNEKELIWLYTWNLTDSV